MSVWNRIHAFLKQVDPDDDDRIDLYYRFNEAIEMREADPGRTIQMLENGRLDARKLDEPWWDLFYEHWILQRFSSTATITPDRRRRRAGPHRHLQAAASGAAVAEAANDRAIAIPTWRCYRLPKAAHFSVMNL